MMKVLLKLLSRFFSFLMALLLVCGDFGAQEKKIWHFPPIYWPRSDGTRCHDLRFFECSYRQLRNLIKQMQVFVLLS